MAYAMTVNVPVVMRPKFVDVYANDTSKNAGKGYGSQVSIKGTVNGKDELIFLKGFTNENVGQLVDAGVIAPSHYEHDPAEKYNIPVVGKHEVTLLLEQPAGQKWPKLKVISSNGVPPAQAKPESATSRLAAQSNYLDAPLPNEEGGDLELKRVEVRKLHAKCFKHVLDNYVPMAAEKGVELDIAGVSALTFQLYKAQADVR